MVNLPYLLALHTIDGIGSFRLKILLDFYQDPKLAWEGKVREWELLKIPRDVIWKWQEATKKLDPDRYLQDLKLKNIQVLTWFDNGYPQLLKQIHDPPLIVYYQGDAQVLNKRSMAVVGTRKMTSYGRLVTEKLAKGLVGAGLVVVSGLARGVDTCAHCSSLEAKGLTVAVLGAGLLQIYPPENQGLARQIVEHGGVVLSEQPPFYEVSAGVFPSRNRIISGLSLGTLVTEAAEDSGSLITARQALEQGREVFAVPGPITSFVSGGTANLIKEGAKLVTSVDDILDELNIPRMAFKKGVDPGNIDLTELEKKVLACLETEQKHIDEIVRELQKTSAEVGSSLIKMEIKGFVKNMGTGVYVKTF